MSHDTSVRPSTPALIADALSQSTTLIETELRLMRTELSEKVTMAVRAVATILVAAVLMLVAMFLVLVGIVELLVAVAGLPPWGAYFAVGAVIAVIGAIALFIALRSLSASNLAPRRTMAQLGKDAEIVKEQVK